MGSLMAPDGTRLQVLQPAAAGPEPIFQKVAIIGVGLMGGSLGLAIRQAWPTSLVIGVDNNTVLETAMRLHAVDVGADDLVVAAEADLVVLAAPISAAIDLMSQLPDNIPGEAVVTDLGATKRAVTEAASRLPSRLRFIGGHPLAGAPRSGIEFARPDLYAGRPWILTPVLEHSGAFDRLTRFIASLGAKPAIQTPAEHDHLMAYLGHLPQIVATSLMHLVGEAVGDGGLELAGRSFIDMTRLASAPAAPWTDVLATNRDEINGALDRLCSLLGSLRGNPESPDAIESLFGSANRWRDRLPAGAGGSANAAEDPRREPPNSQ